MAQTGKKINELTQISSLTNETVLPGVYVNSGVADSTANKISIQQISAKVQNDMSSTLAGKQDTLTAGDNIIIDSNVISSTADSLPSQTGNSGKFLTTDGTSASWATVQAGGAPTITWYTNKTGTTVTIGSTANSDLVKVYKNGILLQPTADYTITYPVPPDNPESGDTLTMVTALVSTDKIAVEVF